MSLNNYELWLILEMINEQESELVKIIKYYIKTYTFITNEELRQVVNKLYRYNIIKDYEKVFGYISYWDVSKITDMSNLFYWIRTFNDDISRWDVSKTINMSRMFNYVYDFNQPLNSWDVSNVTDMKGMFAHALSFNQPLNNWDVSNVFDMSNMFACTNCFNQSLSNWKLLSLIFSNNMYYKSKLIIK